MKLSIITVNLNESIRLEKTILSILSQTWKDFEIIIIDGGSTDGSVDIIKKYENKINYWTSEHDNGIYDAMNKGIKKAKGEYCFFLNSGDYIADPFVLKNIFSENPIEDIIYGNLYITLQGKVVAEARGKKNLTFLDVYSHTIKHQASFIRKKLFEEFGPYNEDRKISADWEFFIKSIGLGGSSWRYYNVFISFFDNDGISNHNAKIASDERQKIINENIPQMMQHDYEFFSKYNRYKILFQNRLSFLLLRILRKILI